MIVIITTLIASVFMQMGYIFWKVAGDHAPKELKQNKRKLILFLLTNKLWLLGMLATTIGWVLFIKATELGEITIVQPLMSAADMLLAVAIATIFLKEHLRSTEWAGITLAVIGGIAIAIEASVVKPSAISWTNLIILLVGLLATIVILILAGRRKMEIPLACAVGSAFAAGAILTEAMSSHIILIDSATVNITSVVSSPILPFVLISNFAGIFMMQIAFQHGRAAIIIPVQLALTNGLVVLGAIFVFGEDVSLLRFIGVTGTIIGTGLLYRISSIEKKANI